eukprot:COSAG02_NODE_68257_length_251_cov_0.657895_1_plen_83_part_11
MLVDPSSTCRVAARSFQPSQGCSLSTAEFYICGFGGVRGQNTENAIEEYTKREKQPAPEGFRVPCDVHWLTASVNILAALGGQ